MGPQDVNPSARGWAGWRDSARSELLQPLDVPAAPCLPCQNWHRHPRRLLGDAPELLSPGLAGLGCPPGYGQGGGSTERASACPGRKRGAVPSLPWRCSLPSRGASAAPRCVPLSLLVPSIAPAGGEGSGFHPGTQRPPHISPGPAEPLEPRVLLRCRASEELLQSSHPGHLPDPGAGSGAILHDFISLPSNFSVLRQQGLQHPLTGCPQGCGEQRRAVPRRGGSVAATISSGDICEVVASPPTCVPSIHLQCQGWSLWDEPGLSAPGGSPFCGVGHAGDAGSLQPRSNRDPKGCGVPAATRQERPESRPSLSVPHWTPLSLPPLPRCG